MIKLENVSALDLKNYYCGQKEKGILRSNNILNYQDLKTYIENNNEDELLFKKRLLKVEKTVEKYNKIGKDPCIYVTPGYDDELLLRTDMEVFGCNLLLWNPTTENYVKYSKLMNLSIFEIKYLLSHTDSRGDNALCQLKNISDNNIVKIYQAVCMYEEQVLRQASLNNPKSVNLFYLNEDAKREIVKDTLKDIVLYLIDATKEELIWGKLTDPQKKRLISAVVNDKKIDRIIRKNLCDVISNYTTLSELEHEHTKRKALNRFIKK